MQFVVIALTTQRWVVQCDKAFVCDRCFAVIARGGEFLLELEYEYLRVDKESVKQAYFMIIEMTIGSASMLIGADVL